MKCTAFKSDSFYRVCSPRNKKNALHILQIKYVIFYKSVINFCFLRCDEVDSARHTVTDVPLVSRVYN